MSEPQLSDLHYKVIELLVSRPRRIDLLAEAFDLTEDAMRQLITEINELGPYINVSYSVEVPDHFGLSLEGRRDLPASSTSSTRPQPLSLLGGFFVTDANHGVA